MAAKNINDVYEQNEDIKKLLIMNLIALGYKQGQIAKTLDISAGKLSGMLKGAARNAPEVSSLGASGGSE